MSENNEQQNKKPLITKENLKKAGTAVAGAAVSLFTLYYNSRRPVSFLDSWLGSEPKDDYFSNNRRQNELAAKERERKQQHEHEERMLKLRIEAAEKGISLDDEDKKEEK